MKKRVIFFSLLSLCILSLSAFILGMMNSTPIIPIDKGSSIVFTNERPDESDESVLVCVPAAYSTDGGEIIGHYSLGGKRRGSADYRFTTIHLDCGTCFQQASLVRQHKPKSFSDSRHRFRRALCKSDGCYTIVNSSRPITLTDFARTLTEYESAWNLDMGTYAYGWYRDSTGLHYLGLSDIWNKHKQTNWIVVRRQ
jgi:hypothetical protein